MKKFFIIALCLLLASCVTSKKSAESTSVHTADTTASSYQAHTSTEVFGTESTDENTTVVVTEITFQELQQQSTSDSTATNASSVNTTVTITSDGDIIGSFNNVKSIKQTTYKLESTHKNELHESIETDTIAKTAETSQSDIEIVTHTEKKTNSTRGTIIIVVSIVAVFLLYLKRKPIIDFIKKIMIGFVKTISRS